jgi:hypothetical protein
MKLLRISAFALLLALANLMPVPAAHGQEKPVLASPPFLKVGEWYVALYTGEARRPLHFKVLELAGGAWVKVEHQDEVMWLNTNAALLIKPGTKE